MTNILSHIFFFFPIILQNTILPSLLFLIVILLIRYISNSTDIRKFKKISTKIKIVFVSGFNIFYAAIYIYSLPILKDKRYFSTSTLRDFAGQDLTIIDSFVLFFVFSTIILLITAGLLKILESNSKQTS